MDHDRTALHEMTKLLSELGFSYKEDELALTNVPTDVAASALMPTTGENFYALPKGAGDGNRKDGP